MLGGFRWPPLRWPGVRWPPLAIEGVASETQKVIKIYQKGKSHFFTFKKVKMNRSTENNLVTETLAPYNW